jgi:hypothetical protein
VLECEHALVLEAFQEGLSMGNRQRFLLGRGSEILAWLRDVSSRGSEM